MNDKERLNVMSWMLLEYRAYYHRHESKINIHPSWDKFLKISDDLYDDREESYESLRKKLKLPPHDNAVGFGPNSPSQHLVADKLSRPVGSFVILPDGNTYQIKPTKWPTNKVDPTEFDDQIEKAKTAKLKVKNGKAKKTTDQE